MKKIKNILVVEDNRSVRSALAMLISTIAEKVITLPSPSALLSTMAEAKPECVILDMNFSAGINNGNEGLYWLSRLVKSYPAIPVILITAYADIELAIRGIKEGAADFIVKPWDNRKLIESVTYATKRTPKPSSAATAGDDAPLFSDNPSMVLLRSMVEKVAPTDASILITGENGTGKSMLAKYIHSLSPRKGNPLVQVDMGAVTETLFESEFFGHAKGAFTGAAGERKGWIESADNSTLFLDEIANLTLPQQAKLLCALQERKITPVGSNKPVSVNIRLICATSADLESLVMQGKFRQDLLWRINTVHLDLPPLRHRKEDIMPLARKFLIKYSRKYDRDNLTFAPEVSEILLRHPWTGNVRELEHAIEKAVILCDSSSITRHDFVSLASYQAPAAAPAAPATLEEMERKMISEAIRDCEGNMSAVATQLGIARQTLYNKIKKYGL